MSPDAYLAIRRAESFALQRMRAYSVKIGERAITAAIVAELTRRGLACDVAA